MGRERQILDTAAELFHERGFHGVSVDELGSRAGLSGPALYRHFAGKNEILAALFNQAMDELLTAASDVPAAGPDGDPRAALERLIRHHVAFTLGHRHLVNVYQREVRSLGEPHRATFAQRRLDYTQRWEQLVSRCYPTASGPDVSVATQSCLGLIFSITFWPASALRGDGLEDLVVRLAQASLNALETGARDD